MLQEVRDDLDMGILVADIGEGIIDRARETVEGRGVRLVKLLPIIHIHICRHLVSEVDSEKRLEGVELVVHRDPGLAGGGGCGHFRLVFSFGRPVWPGQDLNFEEALWRSIDELNCSHYLY